MVAFCNDYHRGRRLYVKLFERISELEVEDNVLSVSQVIEGQLSLIGGEIRVFGYMLEVVGELTTKGMDPPSFEFDVVYIVEAAPPYDDWLITVESPNYDCRDSDLYSSAIGVESPWVRAQSGREVPGVVHRIEEAGYYPYWIGTRFFFKMPIILTGKLNATPDTRFMLTLDNITHIHIPEHARGRAGIVL